MYVRVHDTHTAKDKRHKRLNKTKKHICNSSLDSSCGSGYDLKSVSHTVTFTSVTVNELFGISVYLSLSSTGLFVIV